MLMESDKSNALKRSGHLGFISTPSNEPLRRQHVIIVLVLALTNVADAVEILMQEYILALPEFEKMIRERSHPFLVGFIST